MWNEFLCEYPSWYWYLLYYTCLRVLFGFSLKAEAWRPMAERVVLVRVEAPPLVLATLAEKIKCGAKASWKTGVRQALRSTSVSGHGWKFAKAVADLALLEVEAGASDKLPITNRQSFKDGRYSPSTGMEEVEWQIMLEQFIVSGVVIKNEVINIDSD
jgi:hypothetical protein